METLRNLFILIVVLIALLFLNISMFKEDNSITSDFISAQKFVINSFIDGQMQVYSFIKELLVIEIIIPFYVHAFLFYIIVVLDLTFLYYQI